MARQIKKKYDVNTTEGMIYHCKLVMTEKESCECPIDHELLLDRLVELQVLRKTYMPDVVYDEELPKYEKPKKVKRKKVVIPEPEPEPPPPPPTSFGSFIPSYDDEDDDDE